MGLLEARPALKLNSEQSLAPALMARIARPSSCADSERFKRPFRGCVGFDDVFCGRFGARNQEKSRQNKLF